MSDAPERIWAWDETNCTDKNPHNKFTTEYIRADLAAAHIEALVKERDEYKRLAAVGELAAQECRIWQGQAEAAEAEVKKLRGALTFYADENSYEKSVYERLSCGCCIDIYEPSYKDNGAIARATLSTTEERHD